ncbi:MAG: hypothetical protein K8R68_07845 [Bacteroidales bacterium]|nr:hypothetical protein [Bacteroidales bacterium]
MKTINIILTIILTGIYLNIFAQTTDKSDFFRLKSWNFQAGSHVNRKISDEFNNKWIDRVQFNSTISFRSFNIISSDVIYVSENQNHLSEFFQTYVQIPKTFYKSRFIPKGTKIYINAGLMRWLPKYTDMVLISEKFYNDFFNPDNSTFVGFGAGFSVPLLKKNRLVAKFNGISGDIFDQKNMPASIKDAYLQGNLPIYTNISLFAQVGIADGFQHIVNCAFLQYRPSYDKLAFNFKLGKLPGYDKTPYGLSVQVSRKFNYVELGAFYQIRMNQDPNMPQIAGFTFSFIKPKKLVEIWNTYSFWYNFYENTFMFNVPLLKINLLYKK